jgi:hypothetical protein
MAKTTMPFVQKGALAMAQTERDPENGWETEEPILPPSHRGQKDDVTGPKGPDRYAELSLDGASPDMEPAWRAAYALMQLKCETLLSVMLRPSFHPIQDTTMVPIYPCPHCGDGGLRTAGTVRMRKGTAFVRACDTCCAVEIGERQIER